MWCLTCWEDQYAWAWGWNQWYKSSLRVIKWLLFSNSMLTDPEGNCVNKSLWFELYTETIVVDYRLIVHQNLHIFCSMSSTGYCRATRNPYDRTKVAGGSSSGSAAVVSSGLCPAALGVDGGGNQFLSCTWTINCKWVQWFRYLYYVIIGHYLFLHHDIFLRF